MLPVIFISLTAFSITVYISYTFLCYLKAKKKKDGIREQVHPSVTLIVCAYNEEAVIAKKIKDIAELNYPEEKLKVWFINDHSTDRTREIILDNSHQIPFAARLFDNELDRGKINALNYIFPQIETEATVITDADSLLDPESIAELVSDFKSESIGGSNGVVKILPSKDSDYTRQNEVFYRKLYDLWRSGESAIHSISICNGPIMAFRTSLIKDAQLKTLSDDTELLFRIIRQGYRVVYNKKAVAYECTPSALTEQINQKMRRCKGVIQVYLKNLDLLGRGVFGRAIFPFALLQFCVVPWVVVAGTVVYFFLALENPIWLLLLGWLFVPKLNKALLNALSTQFIMAFCPFYRNKAWNTMKTSRESLAAYEPKIHK